MNSDFKKFRTAYILQIHKNPDQVNKFIKQIISKGHADVFVHIDKKNYALLSDRILKRPSVFILENCIDVTWGDISQVEASILLLREVLNSGKKYDFICFRSGQDLLVKDRFQDFLMNNQNKIFMNAYYVDRKEPHASFVSVRWPKWARKLYKNPFHPYRVFRRSIACLYAMGLNLSPNRHTLPENFPIYNGSNWFCIPLDVAKYIIEFLDKNNWYYKAFIDSLVPDEFFFQTLIMNSSYKTQVVNHNLMYIKFGESLKTRNNPITLKMEHINIIKNSNEFFARKFDQSLDNQVIDYFSSEVSH